ncbi:efflux RND transporter periplasmic adaptor subunit [Rhodopirellula sp. P2]|uniref:efflux RND transporter periplasmic adaptor subunit n=1 Tax=Rhodopirellula sp. P2 TaxID=2127060 RepID=UPI0023677D53|nr:efflux RND transporter periplasmic adaptor subunit [Rhodopirellula sp. P2]WDQ16410.1 efflux RND transporter periplasmic adaptor subunit [Rhodopirellula sp. P2]
MPKIIRSILFVGVLVGIAVGYWYWRSQQNLQESSELVLYSNVDVRQVELAINGNERIAELKVEEGDRVTTGQLLAKLNTERLEHSVARAQAIVDAQKQVVARLEAGSRKEEIAKSLADVEEAQATAVDKERTIARLRKLLKSNAASQQEVDDALAEYNAIQASIRSLQAVADLVLAGPREEDIAEAKATLKRYEAELAQAEHDLSDGALHAPSVGVIQTRILEVGDMASPLKPVFTMALIDPVWVRAYVSEPDLGKISEGMTAIVITDSFPDKEYVGWIGFISPSAEFTPKPVETSELRTKLVYQVRVFVKNPDNELRLGMPATVRIPLHQTADKSNQAEPNDGDLEAGDPPAPEATNVVTRP